MRKEAERGIRRLLLTVTTFTSVVSLFALWAIRYLPQDPYQLRSSLLLYTIWFMLVSLIGWYAAMKRSTTLVYVYAIHLVVDAVLFFIPRILLIQFSTTLPSLICSNSAYPEQSSHIAVEGMRHKLGAQMKALSDPADSPGSCRVWMWSLETLFIGMMVLHSVASVLLSARCFGYAGWLSRMERLQTHLDRSYV